MTKKHLIICILLTVIVYANSIKNDFTWDDEYVVVQNEFIRDIKNIPNFFIDRDYQATAPGLTCYRPLRSVLHTIVYSIFGPMPFNYHALNLFFHILNIIIIYYLVRKISDCDRAFFCSLIFSVHPILTEGVSSITGLTDVLCTFFYISGLFLFINFTKSRLVFISFFCFILSILSKEVGLTMPGIIVLYLFSYNNYSLNILKEKRFLKDKNILCLLVFSLIIVCYLAIWKKTVGEVDFYAGNGGSYYNNLLMIPKIFITYFRLLAFPINQSIRYDVGFSYSVFDPNVFLSIIFILPIIISAFILFHKKKLFSFGILWFFITIIPVSNILPIPASMMGERFLYLPSIGIFIALSDIIIRFRDHIKTKTFKSINLIIFISIIILFSTLTIKRNFLWKNNLLLFNDAKDKAPDSLAVRLNLVREYEKIKDFKSAEREYMEAVRINILNAKLHVTWGMNHLKNNNLTNAKDEFKRAVKTNPTLVEPHIELALVYEKLKDLDSAKKEWTEVLKLDNKNTQALARKFNE